MNSAASNPPTITMANGRCESEPMPRESAAGNKPRMATSMVIMIGRKRRIAPSHRGVFDRIALRAQVVDVLDHDHADLHGNSKQRQETRRRWRH